MTINVTKLRAFVDEVKNVFVKPADFFAVMPLSGGFTEPVIKTLIYSSVASLVTFIMPSAIAGETNGIVASSVGIFDIIQFIVYSFIGFLGFSAIIFALSSICNGNLNYEASFRVASSLFVLCPVTLIIAFIFLKSQILGTITLLAVVMYGFRMLYLAITRALGAKEIMAKRIIIALAVIPALVIITSFIWERITYGPTNRVQINTPSHLQENFTGDGHVDMNSGNDSLTLPEYQRQIDQDKTGNNGDYLIPDEKSADK